jgi:hypothetical protein
MFTGGAAPQLPPGRSNPHAGSFKDMMGSCRPQPTSGQDTHGVVQVPEEQPHYEPLQVNNAITTPTDKQRNQWCICTSNP